MEVPGQTQRRVRDPLEPRDAAHVHHVRGSVAFDDVDTVEVDAEGLPAAPDDLAQLRRGRERLSMLLIFGPAGEDLLHAEDAPADRIHLPVAALRRVIALGEHGIAAVPLPALLVRHVRQLSGALDGAAAVAV